MAFLSLGTHEFLKTEEGKLKRITIWHKVILTGKLAEIGESLLTKGAAVQVAGKLVNRVVKSKDGLVHKTTEIRAKDLVIMGKSIIRQNNATRQSGFNPRITLAHGQE
jgi:single-strand DNA-binding protein